MVILSSAATSFPFRNRYLGILLACVRSVSAPNSMQMVTGLVIFYWASFDLLRLNFNCDKNWKATYTCDITQPMNIREWEGDLFLRRLTANGFSV
jgi:hypothetical protein